MAGRRSVGTVAVLLATASRLVTTCVAAAAARPAIGEKQVLRRQHHQRRQGERRRIEGGRSSGDWSAFPEEGGWSTGDGWMAAAEAETSDIVVLVMSKSSKQKARGDKGSKPMKSRPKKKEKEGTSRSKAAKGRGDKASGEASSSGGGRPPRPRIVDWVDDGWDDDYYPSGSSSGGTNRYKAVQKGVDHGEHGVDHGQRAGKPGKKSHGPKETSDKGRGRNKNSGRRRALLQPFATGSRGSGALDSPSEGGRSTGDGRSVPPEEGGWSAGEGRMDAAGAEEPESGNVVLVMSQSSRMPTRKPTAASAPATCEDRKWRYSQEFQECTNTERTDNEPVVAYYNTLGDCCDAELPAADGAEDGACIDSYYDMCAPPSLPPAANDGCAEANSVWYHVPVFASLTNTCTNMEIPGMEFQEYSGLAECCEEHNHSNLGNMDSTISSCRKFDVCNPEMLLPEPIPSLTPGVGGEDTSVAGGILPVNPQ